MDSPPVPDELLVDIFLRLAEPADLVRAAAACVSFCRLVADRSFLRQYRKLYAPPLLGFIFGVERKNFFFHRRQPAHFVLQPAIAPHSSAPAGSAVALAADFSFAFLPGCGWRVQDIRDGRVLLARNNFQRGTLSSIYAFTQIVVCDPLHRRYLLLPPIPDDVVTALEVVQRPYHTFLVPSACSGDKEEVAEETAFRVIWMVRRGDNLVALVFSSSTGQWQAGPSHSWSDSFKSLLKLPEVANSYGPQYAYGCFYWVTGCTEKLLVLDTRRMEFSITGAPPEAKDSANVVIAIVEAGRGMLGVFVLSHDTPDLSFIIRRNNGGSSVQWQLEKTISLGFQYNFAGSTGKHLFLEHAGDCFSLDLRTFQLEKLSVRASKHSLIWPHAYSNFPPSLLSSPTVASGVELGTEKETLEQRGAPRSSA